MSQEVANKSHSSHTGHTRLRNFGPMTGADPRSALGALGERLARAHLEARGLVVLDANYRTRHGELDLVALDERSLIFCEVKTRLAPRPRADAPAELGPLAGIDARKRRKVRLIARQWLARYGSDAPWRPELRFDAVAVELDADGRLVSLDHMEGAF